MTTDPIGETTPESARALLYRHGLPEDVLDGALTLHAQELAAVQRKAHDERRPHFHMGLPCTPGFGCHVGELIDLIDPTRAEPAAVASPPPDQTDLRDRIAAALYERERPPRDPAWADAYAMDRETFEEMAAAVLAVLPPPADRAAVLREAAEDLATAFGDPKAKHIGAIAASHLRRRAQELEGRETDEEHPETPLEKRFRYSERRNDELRAECQRRGRTNLEYAEKIERLEKQLDEVRTQLGAEILRAGQAEATLERIREVARRLANHAVGFQDVLDDSDRGPWAKTVGADIAELRRLAAEAQQQPETQRTCAHCRLPITGSGVTHFGPPEGPHYHVDRKACRAAGGLPPRAGEEADPVVEPHCDGFPTTCPNPVTVPPAPPHHDGGIRCGCYDQEQP